MKKLLNPTTLLCFIFMIIVASCSKEEENLFDRVQNDVSNTKWLAVNDGDSYELKFDKEKYYLNYYLSNGDQYKISGTYKQNKNKITFQQRQFITFTIMTLKEGEITKGSLMNVPVYYDNSYIDADIAFTLKFTPVE